MSTKPLSPLAKTALELGPVVAFFVAYLRLRDQVFTFGGVEYDGFIVVTGGFVVVFAATIALIWRLTGEVSRMQIVTLVLVVVFGGLTVWLNDERFIKMKPTLIYLIFGGLLAVGLVQGKSYLRYVMEGMMPLQDAGWMILTRRLMVFFFALAGTNELVWRFMSTDAWVNFKTFGLTAALFLFFITQSGLFSKYGVDEEAAQKDD